jgi:tRNA-splicing ligase RtcB (3'-phosphate/5'-hydroxy nucleic acid ligase)
LTDSEINNGNKFEERIKEIRLNFKGLEIKEKIDEARKDLGLNDHIDNELKYLTGQHSYEYLFDMIFAQKYAEFNRSSIASIIMTLLGVEEIERIETVHNFIDFKDMIIRKGSIRSYIGERMILPLNMRDGILICDGKSNPEWNFSAPHGAGRVLSRTNAKKTLSLKSFKTQMTGIFSTSIGQSTLDEAPDAYKNAKIIEEAIEPTATIINRIRPIINMKDNGSR